MLRRYIYTASGPIVCGSSFNRVYFNLHTIALFDVQNIIIMFFCNGLIDWFVVKVTVNHIVFAYLNLLKRS